MIKEGLIFFLSILSFNVLAQGSKVDTSYSSCQGEFFTLKTSCMAGSLFSKKNSCSVEFELPLAKCDKIINCLITQNEHQKAAIDEFISYVSLKVKPESISQRLELLFNDLDSLASINDCINFSDKVISTRQEISKLSPKNKQLLNEYIYSKLGWNWF